LGVKPKPEQEQSPKNAVTAFMTVLADKMTTGHHVEVRKLDLELEKFQYEQRKESTLVRLILLTTLACSPLTSSSLFNLG